MGAESKIEWTHHTFNPWWGCVRVSPGCENCYAEAFAKRTGHGVWGVQSPRRFFGEKHWTGADSPVAWNRDAAARGVRERVFCASMADVFEDRADLVPWRARLFELVEATPALDWLLLTKRPENLRRMLPPAWLEAPRPNVWLGTTVEDGKRGRERIPELVAVPAVVRFLSCEPLLSYVGVTDLFGGTWRCTCCGATQRDHYDPAWRWAGDHWQHSCPDAHPQAGHHRAEPLRDSPIHWVIVGGESGGGSRPFHLAHARGLVRQCRAAGVKVFVKQLGAVPVTTEEAWRSEGTRLIRPHKRTPRGHVALSLHDPKGGALEEFPADLQIREFPDVHHV